MSGHARARRPQTGLGQCTSPLIDPGPIQTNIITRMNLSPEEDRRARDWIQSQVPMKRIGRPEEIAAAVLYLSSDESSFTIGSELIIDGGMATL